MFALHLAIIAAPLLSTSHAFTSPAASSSRRHCRHPCQPDIPPRPPRSIATLRSFFDNDSSDAVEIPSALREEIYAAEANTPAAQGRQQRIIVYVVLTLAGVLITFSNAFLTDLRFGDGSPSEDLGYYGFDWVEKNFLTGFFLTNKIGGALGLLGAGLSGTLAEAEIRSKDENAQMIWLEMQRRKSAKDQPQRSKKKKGRRATSKRDMTGKQKKRLSALEELMVEDNAQSTIEKNESEPITIDPEDDSIKGEGLLDKMKNFYDQADQMAATNALILNKELEDRGVLEKITDETGLKVVGKDAAESKSSDEKKD